MGHSLLNIDSGTVDDSKMVVPEISKHLRCLQFPPQHISS